MLLARRHMRIHSGRRGSVTNMCRLVLVLVAGLATACGGDSASTTAPSTPSTDTFTSTLAVRGAATHTFTLSAAGTLTVTLDAITPVAIVGLGFGVPDASGACGLTASVETAGGATDQLINAVQAGSYCVKIYDVGNLTQAASFSIS